MQNTLDGAGQESRKVMIKALGFKDLQEVTREQIDERLRFGMSDFEAFLQQSGSAKLPGCGAIVIVDVGRRLRGAHEPRIIDESKVLRRFAALARVNYCFRPRSDQHRNGNPRLGQRRYWPGLVKQVLTFHPGDSGAIASAVSAGELEPMTLKGHLVALAGIVSDSVREATKIGTADEGLEVEFVVYHLEQGCIHAHLFARDIDINDPARRRLGLRVDQKGERKQTPRLTLNSLGVSGVAMLRHKEAGHPAPYMALKTEIIHDWRILEMSLSQREKKKLGPCWDVVLSKTIDKYWANVFSAPPLARRYNLAYAEWQAKWKAQLQKAYDALRTPFEEERGALINRLKKAEITVGTYNLQRLADEKRASFRSCLHRLIAGVKVPDGELNANRFSSSGKFVSDWKPFRTILLGPAPLKHAIDEVDELGRALEAHQLGKPLPTTPIHAGEIIVEKIVEKTVSVVPPETLDEIRRLKAENQLLKQEIANLRRPAWMDLSFAALVEAIERVAIGRAIVHDSMILDSNGNIHGAIRARINQAAVGVGPDRFLAIEAQAAIETFDRNFGRSKTENDRAPRDHGNSGGARH